MTPSDWLTPCARAFYGPTLVYIAAPPEQRKDGAWEVQASVFSTLGQPFPVPVAKLERIVTAGELEAIEVENAKLKDTLNKAAMAVYAAVTTTSDYGRLMSLIKEANELLNKEEF